MRSWEDEIRKLIVSHPIRISVTVCLDQDITTKFINFKGILTQKLPNFISIQETFF